MDIRKMIALGMLDVDAPKNLTIDFTALGTGGMVGLNGATWTRSAAGAVNTPTATGNELVANGGFDSDTANWNAGSGAVLSSIAGGQSGNCLEIKSTGTSSPNARQTVTTEADSWYDFRVYHKNGSAPGRIRAGTTLGGANISDTGTISDVAWANKIVAYRSPVTSTFLWLSMIGATADLTTLFDTVTIFKLSLPTLFAWRKFATQYGKVEAGMNIVAGTPEGVYMNMDNSSNPLNMVTCLHNGTNLVGSKRVNGTVTELINTATPYAAGAKPYIYRAPGTNTYQFGYNGSQVGVDQTISDASIINNKIHGLMGTHQQNQVLNFTFTGA